MTWKDKDGRKARHQVPFEAVLSSTCRTIVLLVSCILPRWCNSRCGVVITVLLQLMRYAMPVTGGASYSESISHALAIALSFKNQVGAGCSWTLERVAFCT